MKYRTVGRYGPILNTMYLPTYFSYSLPPMIRYFGCPTTYSRVCSFTALLERLYDKETLQASRIKTSQPIINWHKRNTKCVFQQVVNITIAATIHLPVLCSYDIIILDILSS